MVETHEWKQAPFDATDAMSTIDTWLFLTLHLLKRTKVFLSNRSRFIDLHEESN